MRFFFFVSYPRILLNERYIKYQRYAVRKSLYAIQNALFNTCGKAEDIL